MAIEIVVLFYPLKRVIFHTYVTVYQRVSPYQTAEKTQELLLDLAPIAGEHSKNIEETPSDWWLPSGYYLRPPVTK